MPGKSPLHSFQYADGLPGVQVIAMRQEMINDKVDMVLWNCHILCLSFKWDIQAENKAHNLESLLGTLIEESQVPQMVMEFEYDLRK